MEVDALTRSLQEARESEKRLSKENFALKSQLTKTTIELGDASSANEELSSTCAELKMNIKNLESAQTLTQSELVSAHAASRAKSGELAAARREADEVRAGFEEQIAALEGTMARLVNEKGQQSLEIIRRDEEAAQERDAARELSLSIEAERALNASNQQRIESLQVIERELRDELGALASEIHEANRRERSAEDEMQALNSRFE